MELYRPTPPLHLGSGPESESGQNIGLFISNQTYPFSQALVVNFNGILDPICHVFVKLRSKCLQPLSKLNWSTLRLNKYQRKISVSRDNSKRLFNPILLCWGSGDDKSKWNSTSLQTFRPSDTIRSGEHKTSFVMINWWAANKQNLN